MENSNYKLPFRPLNLMASNGQVETCDVFESIAQNIMLLIKTKKGENRYDEEYGNDVWDVEFDNGISTTIWETIFIKSLIRQINDYEPRLQNPKVQAHITYVEHSYETKGYTEVKKKVKIGINSRLESTGENFNFTTELYLSPMSID
ncbi:MULTISPECIES: GPW/gp25 family protein [Empedobacter]|uniref:GPW/gp25 family protein n=1 Tax=Empedobacter falsenii TaxID=343874 RepID=A0A7H9DRE0_9FLAO|nr:MULTISPECIES: GPW/gp25 family protein [Empedobacter]MDH2206978.1 GPW/gp25 family protein [Empedobacter sp. GD03644]QLL57723.1 GPW/gp25 family protein [Empedobacter falsenii]